MNTLTKAFIIFAAIDLCFVGTTMFFVIKLVRRLLGNKSVLDEIMKAVTKLGKK